MALPGHSHVTVMGHFHSNAINILSYHGIDMAACAMKTHGSAMKAHGSAMAMP